MNEADEKRKSERRNPQNEGKELSGIGGVFSGVSLQDVFSDSAGSSGIMLKTTCRPVADGENASQLGIPEKKRKRRVGRKTMPGEQKRTRKLQLHRTEQEYHHYRQRQQTQGRKSMTDYLRDLVITTRMTIKSVALIISRQVLRQIINRYVGII